MNTNLYLCHKLIAVLVFEDSNREPHSLIFFVHKQPRQEDKVANRYWSLMPPSWGQQHDLKGEQYLANGVHEGRMLLLRSHEPMPIDGNLVQYPERRMQVKAVIELSDPATYKTKSTVNGNVLKTYLGSNEVILPEYFDRLKDVVDAAIAEDPGELNEPRFDPVTNQYVED